MPWRFAASGAHEVTPNTCEAKILDDLDDLDDLGAASVPVPPRSQVELVDAGALPPWLSDEAVHRSHRSALLRKEPDWYGRAPDDVPDDLPYVWPVRRAG